MSLSDRSSKRQSPYLPSLPLPSPCQRSGRKLFVSLHPGRAPNQPPLHTITRRRNLFLASRWMQRLSQYKPSGLTHRRELPRSRHSASLPGPGTCSSFRPGLLHSPLSLAGRLISMFSAHLLRHLGKFVPQPPPLGGIKHSFSLPLFL